ncbi:polyprenyl synthetase family protein [Aneurinibacillus tyrosinisolvens]|uniref:polyprenyl synthetase family protein n=1 Tax=Aneurinibacillus tyrosinisolvens TaxID=1443435 RepID=UPI00063F63D3|nr:polyprenyl synthetase family protein [Aneurinibacillus tyrosinisolvens]
MVENEERIQFEMIAAVEKYISQKEIQDYLSRFIEQKAEGRFPFGKLAVSHYCAFGGEHKDIYKAAAAVELVILSLDIFDDLQDQDNDLMLWSQIALPVSMNLATGLLTLGIQLLCDTAFAIEKKMNALAFINSLVTNAVSGQHKDITNAVRSEAEYIQTTKEKSGSLLAMACLVGTALVTAEHHAAVRQYGEHVGIAAQIHNDIVDITRRDRKNDILHKKRTLPALFFLQKNERIKKYYEGTLEQHQILADKHAIVDEIKKSGVIEYAQVVARIHLYQAANLIQAMDISSEVKTKLFVSLDIPQNMAGSRN